MRRAIAIAIEPYYYCRLCHWGTEGKEEMDKHYMEEHTDEEAFEDLGYDPKDFPEEDE